MKRKLIFTLAALATLGALLGWGCARSHARRVLEAELCFRYVDGPLADYAFFTTRALPALRAGDRATLQAALKSAHASAAGFEGLLKGATESWTTERLLRLKPLHQAAAELAQGWVDQPKAEPLSRKLERERQLRNEIGLVLEEMRGRASSDWRLPQARILELNALVFSLSELDGTQK